MKSKLLSFLLVFLVSAIAQAEVKYVAEVKAEDNSVINGKFNIKSQIGLRFEIVNLDRKVLYFVPSIRYNQGMWNIGPEVRFPVLWGDRTRYLLKLELNP